VPNLKRYKVVQLILLRKIEIKEIVIFLIILFGNLKLMSFFEAKS
jgi:hypothetical protein